MSHVTNVRLCDRVFVRISVLTDEKQPSTTSTVFVQMCFIDTKIVYLGSGIGTGVIALGGRNDVL
jgi:hypothetical protein